MKILLINPIIREWAEPNILPLGIAYIASVVRNAGHEVAVYDINALRDDKETVEQKIKYSKADVFGIGGLITTYAYVKWLVDIIRKYHQSEKIIIGGKVAYGFYVLEDEVDYVCHGEGERAIIHYLKLIDGYRSQYPSLISDLDEIPFPAWDLFPMDIYLKNPIGAINKNKWIDGTAEGVPLSMNLYASRGCLFNCLYCSKDFVEKYRLRSVGNVVHEIETLLTNYGVTYFHFVDDEFMLNRNFVYEFCNEMQYLRSFYKIDLTWGATGRVNLVNRDILEAMKDAGMAQICYGIESGSQQMLDFIKKQVRVEQAERAVRLSQEILGMEAVDCSFMVGYPGEDEKSIQDTIDFCKKLSLKPEVIFFLTAYPQTELYEMSKNMGLIRDEEEYLLRLSGNEQGEKILINYTGWSDEELYKIQKNMIKKLGAQNVRKH